MSIGNSFDIGDFKKGMIAGAFMLGYMMFAPMAGFLTQYIRGTRIMAAGLLLWVISHFPYVFPFILFLKIVAAGCASVSWDFWPLAASRIFLGFGEATFASIAPSIIDDVCPRKSRTVWLAVYFMAIPVGTALGFIAGGYFSSLWSWRIVFIVEACLMIPFPVIMFFLPNMSVIVENGVRKLGRVEKASREEEYVRTDEQVTASVKRGILESLGIMITNIVYVFTVLGLSCLTFTLGGMQFWVREDWSFFFQLIYFF